MICLTFANPATIFWLPVQNLDKLLDMFLLLANINIRLLFLSEFFPECQVSQTLSRFVGLQQEKKSSFKLEIEAPLPCFDFFLFSAFQIESRNLVQIRQMETDEMGIRSEQSTEDWELLIADCWLMINVPFGGHCIVLADLSWWHNKQAFETGWS